MELYGITGLTTAEAERAKKEYKGNVTVKQTPAFLNLILGLIKEPMILLLLLAAGFYFSSGHWEDGLFLSASVVVVASISIFQESKSRKALLRLKDATVPKAKVIRDGNIKILPVEELVKGDVIIVEEGSLLLADGNILHANDFSVNESILTGESLPVYKSENDSDPMVYEGCSVVSGLAIIKITAIGSETRFSAIERSVKTIETEKTPLEIQINNFVKFMALAGSIAFAIVWLLNYLSSADWRDSLLKALTLAMSVLPEEIPVAFSTFMAIGAWKLMKMGVLVKNLKTVEALGSATVICVDKTGTITKNQMSLARIWAAQSPEIRSLSEPLSPAEIDLIEIAMWASEPIPFDPMEKALHEAYAMLVKKDQRPDFKMIQEYPLSGKPPMMTHVFSDESGHRIIACKGAAETVLRASGIPDDPEVTKIIEQMSAQGYRVLAVAEVKDFKDNLPDKQQEFQFNFKGLVSFYDPPKENIAGVLESFYTAGIDVKIITGDNLATSAAIARQIGFRGSEAVIGGEELMNISDQELISRVDTLHLFTRMFPEAKLRVINALKACGQVVAMTGDGVNDAPALKAAHIGIAMGGKGTEAAKQAASLVLLKDNLNAMVGAIALGRRIYTNLKKAIRYIISIHLPIIAVVFVPLVLGWAYPSIFSPVHVIILELIMGPTCSLIYENEPMEKNTMKQKPRPLTTTFFSLPELMTSVLQGIVIATGALGLYHYAIKEHLDIETTRTIVFTTLIFANISLTLVNRSFYYSIFTTLRYKNKLLTLIISITIAMLLMALYVPPVTSFLGFKALDFHLLLISGIVGIVSAGWYELLKWYKRSFKSSQ